MLTTLHPSDRVLVNKLSYRLHDPRRGDVVVLKRIETNAQERDLIKRVVALPGETLEYRDCQLYINGALINEPYLDPQIVSPNRCGADQPPVKVEPKHVFVMGDNRGGSLDSRDSTVGQIDYSNLIGRAFVVMWPFSDWQWL
jgi:signal peptidase I